MNACYITVFNLDRLQVPNRLCITFFRSEFGQLTKVVDFPHKDLVVKPVPFHDRFEQKPNGQVELSTCQAFSIRFGVYNSDILK